MVVVTPTRDYTQLAEPPGEFLAQRVQIDLTLNVLRGLEKVLQIARRGRDTHWTRLVQYLNIRKKLMEA